MAKQKKILIVEDEQPLRNALHDKCKQEGLLSFEAKNGEEGLEVALREQPDIILLDLVMPKMDGMTMLKQLRQDDWGKDAKVILLTNLSDAEKVAEAMTAGAHDFLVKSDWKIDDVLTKVWDRLGKHS